MQTNADPVRQDGPLSKPATGDDRYFDYCLEPYRPRRPWQGKLRSESLLWSSLSVGGALDPLREPLEAIQAHVGTDLTIWGVKWDGRSLWWELYFYDPQKVSKAATIGSIREALAPWIRIVPTSPESIPYMMVSFDLTAAARGADVEAYNLYLTGQKAHAGRSYKVRADRVELENTYRFMEPKRSIDELMPLLKASVFVDYASDPTVLSKVLLPELFACKKICVSKKRHCDAIYYSGITVEQLLWFFEWLDYPPALVEFVRERRESFEHLYFDVGLDYRQAPDGSIVHPKSSYYGML